jgi:hypothetical protein
MKVGEIWKSKEDGKLVRIVEINYIDDLEMVKSLKIGDILRDNGFDFGDLMEEADKKRQDAALKSIDEAVVKADYEVIYKYLDVKDWMDEIGIFMFSKEFLAEFEKVRDA